MKFKIVCFKRIIAGTLVSSTLTTQIMPQMSYVYAQDLQNSDEKKLDDFITIITPEVPTIIGDESAQLDYERNLNDFTTIDGCIGLDTVEIPKNVQTIGTNAFANTHLNLFDVKSTSITSNNEIFGNGSAPKYVYNLESNTVSLNINSSDTYISFIDFTTESPTDSFPKGPWILAPLDPIKITLNLDGGSGTNKYEEKFDSLESTVEENLEKIEEPTKDGFIFDRWELQFGEFESWEYDSISDLRLFNPINHKVKWVADDETETYTVNIDIDLGSDFQYNAYSYDVAVGSSITINIPEIDGYEFVEFVPGENTVYQEISMIEGDIEDLIGKGIINGYEDGSFQPDSTTKRSEFVILVNKAIERPKKSQKKNYYIDLEDELYWAYDQVMNASNYGTLYEDIRNAAEQYGLDD